MAIMGRHRSFHRCGYFVISFVILMMIISPHMLLQVSPPTMAQSNSDSVYNLVIHGKIYTINYHITGGRVNNITGEKENSTLLVGL